MKDNTFYLRRSSGGYLIWHNYETNARRMKWAAIYHARGDTIWMNEDGSIDGLFYLHDEDAWTP